MTHTGHMKPLEMDTTEDRFRECLEKHEAIIWKVVFSFTSDTVSNKELYQDILLEIWQALPNFRGESRLSTWMYSVAFRTAMGLSRKKKTRLKREVSIDVFGSESDLFAFKNDEVETAERNAKIQALYRAIRQLSEVDRSLTLMHLDGLSYREIGETLSMSENNVGARLTRIRNKLAGILKEMEEKQ